MKKTLIVYESKYNSTQQIAKSLALVLGPARCCKPCEFKSEYKDFDFIVIGTPIYSERIDKNILDFVSTNCEWLRCKKIVLFCTCLDLNKGETYLEPLKNILKDSIIWSGAFGGRLEIKMLDRNDSNSIKNFCTKLNLPNNSIGMFRLDQVIAASLEIKNILDKSQNPIPLQKLKLHIEDFLKKHNTCTLSTGYSSSIRGTPIEYSYLDECIYILSEGGVKFSNILLNNNVSISVYDEYKNMNELGGLQISGKADIVEINSEEYVKVIRNKGINIDRILSLPINMNLIRVKPGRTEFLWSDFRKQGYGVKQYYEFT